ncbi:hypothetical protein ACE38W_12090 [Chitinophaga sp. Hz27]|uniref:hypothetical protein n=1 Tax=Chitinophaga sp. Hz27 TaxID=3347169 RepID=UPI0035E255C6
MKLKSLLPVALVITMTAMVISCQKNADTTSEVVPQGTKNVKVNFTGDISTTESPLGRKNTNDLSLAKTFADSTVYAIYVNQDGKAQFHGLYSKTDSVILRIPNSGSIDVNAIALKKGTGPGIYCESHIDYFSGKPVFNYPWFGVIPYNFMDTIYLGKLMYSVDSINNILLFNDLGTNAAQTTTRNSEIDSYVGRVSFNATQTPAAINLNMKRISFGIKYNVSNFANGKLIVDFGGLMPAKTFTTTSDLSKVFVYTANELQWVDSLNLNPINLALKWEKPDGSIVPIGSKRISFKRNVLTDINITVPNQGTGIPTMPIDSNWQKRESINF